MKKRIFLFIVLLIIWLLLTLPFDIQNFLLGLGVCFLVTAIFKDYYSENVIEILKLKKLYNMIKYIFVFVYYMILANLDVMYRVIHPGLPISPGIVKVKTKLKSSIARTILANSITLTPGTLTVDIKDEYLYIHWINVKNVELNSATSAIVGRFERILMEIFK